MMPVIFHKKARKNLFPTIYNNTYNNNEGIILLVTYYIVQEIKNISINYQSVDALANSKCAPLTKMNICAKLLVLKPLMFLGILGALCIHCVQVQAEAFC